jgi:acetoin utilization deacetylase AcuC-like enzyme
VPAVFYDPSFFEHDTGPGHPESATRLRAVIEVCEVVSGLKIIAECPEATGENIQLIHTPHYCNLISNLPRNKMTMLDPDTVFGPGSFKAAMKAVGAVIEAVNYVYAEPDRRAFCAVRPPGHHALANRAMGFCIFNNIAVGAAYAIATGKARKIAIIDWDLHHGNGTQDAFYANPDVLYISLHQYPYYPGTGSSAETGIGTGAGFTLNLPMPPGTGNNGYRQAFTKKVLPAIAEFRPDLIMISAGFRP